jgi:hypothetical protein
LHAIIAAGVIATTKIGAREPIGKSSLTTSRKPVGVWAGSRLLIWKAEQSRIVDAHRDGGKRFVVHADEKLTAFLELQAAIDAR